MAEIVAWIKPKYVNTLPGRGKKISAVGRMATPYGLQLVVLSKLLKRVLPLGIKQSVSHRGADHLCGNERFGAKSRHHFQSNRFGARQVGS
jgi:hypothetical protein